MTRRTRLLGALAGGVLLILLQAGCIRTMVMVGKVLMGDPMQTSGFELATGINLKKEEKQILIHCTAPSFVTESYGTLTRDVEEELIRRMKRHELKVLHPDVAVNVFDRLGGTFDPQALAREVENVDYVIHIQIDQFRYIEESSPNFYRGHAAGRIIGFEVRGDAGEKHAIQVFDQQFQSTYPTTYPVAVDQTPKAVFIRRFVDHIADSLGASFYDVTRSDLYAL
jgi:hypothetical protein